MGKDGKNGDGKGMARDNRNNEKKGESNNNPDGRDTDKKEDGPRSGRVVIKSCPTKPTRITLRNANTKPAEMVRPPWNTGSPSPTSIKAIPAQGKRSIRSLRKNVPCRPKVYRQEEGLSSSTARDSHEITASKAEPLPPSPPPEPSNLIITPEDPKTGLEWDYKRLEEFLQLAAGIATSPEAKGLCTAIPMTQSSMVPKDQSIDQLSTDVGLKEAQRSAGAAAATIVAVPSQDETQKRALLQTRVRPDQLFQLGQESSGDEHAAPQGITQSAPTVGVKTQSHIARDGLNYTLQFDAETSGNEQAALRPEARSIPCMIKVPWPGPRALPISNLQYDSESADDVGPQRATLPLALVQLHQHPFIEEQTTPRRLVQPNHSVPRDQHCTSNKSKSTRAEIVRGDSPFHADGESCGEDYASMSKVIENRNRRLRQSRSQCSIKSVKRDPAIIACGPITTTRKQSSQPKANESPEISKYVSKKDGIEENLEAFRKTIGQWKKGDRKAIQKFLEALKNLDSDEESITKSKAASKKDQAQSKTLSNAAPRKRLNPLAPAFREFSSQNATDDSQREMSLSVRRRRPHSVEDTKERPLIKESAQTRKPIPRTIRSYCGPRVPELVKQEPIWINNFQPPITIDAAADEEEDGGFQEFCRANNYIPLVHVNPNPIIPIAPPDPIIPILPPYPLLLRDHLSMTYTSPLDGLKPNLLTVCNSGRVEVSEGPCTLPASTYQSIANQDFTFTLEETSEPIRHDGSREAKALDLAWGAQILDNFVQRYPMTGQRKPSFRVFEQNENGKSAPKDLQKQRSKVDRKVSGVQARINAATAIQQRLEMILLLEKKGKAPLAPANKIRATNIQQKLEIMLYKLKEQKALAAFSKRVR